MPVCHPSVCSSLSHLFHFLHDTAFLPHSRNISQFCLHTPFCLSTIVARSSAAPFPRPTLVGFGGQQAMTVVLAVDFEVTFAQHH